MGAALRPIATQGRSYKDGAESVGAASRRETRAKPLASGIEATKVSSSFSLGGLGGALPWML
ncbi:hypothetical protein JOE27_004129 [Pseudomonas sp. M5]|uniref:Uncharacterized protein n=1 Tax=Pseudomonas putida TaxID=303 RepID=A0A379KJ76_PSEPU|nr:hypothetical protein [Pseudomonas sp. M2]MBM7399374.1 hypothetical protein [Pseudomonas sp. M5]SUD67456.1 Uncharacterised protein [Pseudomonas putida]